jgi:hypothetical protein
MATLGWSGIAFITLINVSRSGVALASTFCIVRLQPLDSGLKDPDASQRKTPLQATPWARARWYKRSWEPALATEKRRLGVILYRPATSTSNSTSLPRRSNRSPIMLPALESRISSRYLNCARSFSLTLIRISPTLIFESDGPCCMTRSATSIPTSFGKVSRKALPHS